MRRMRVQRALKILLIVVAASAVFGYAVKLLWNWLMPAIFGLHAISFWQALGLFILGKILFGGFRGRPGFRPGFRGGHWRERMKEKWEHMTPEQRERLRQGMKDCRDRFSHRPEPTP